MAKKEIIRFVVDTNVLGFLALATKSKQKFFYRYPKSTETLYNSLIWLDSMLQCGKVELVLPYVVFHELIKNKPEPLSTQKNMTPQQLANFEHKRYFKIIAKSYIRNNPAIKLAFMEGGIIKEYGEKVVALAKKYSEQAKYPEDIALSHQLKEKPFIMIGDYPSNDALIMAEATLMGFNLITFDKHFLTKKPFNIPNGIWQINMEEFESGVRPVSFMGLIKAMKREGTDLPYLKRTFKNTKFPRFVNYDLLTHEQYGNKVEEVLQSKKEYSFDLKNIAHLRTLFLKYMQEPLDVDNLQCEAQLQEEDFQVPATEITSEPLEPKPQPAVPPKPKAPKPKSQTVTQTPSAPKKKIKFNLSGGQDFDGLAAFLDKQKEDNQLGL